jgi:carbon monoxide dehydrogenase subunit G
MSTLANYKLAIKMPFLIKAMMGKKANELIQRNASDFFSKLEEHLKS